MTVNRTRPLPRTRGRGALVVSAQVAGATSTLLREIGANGKLHEALVYWAGRTVGATTYVLAAVAPQCERSAYGVFADERAIGAAARQARRHQLGLVAQVHSHPGTDTRHSDGDDELILMPFEGMFSLVVGRYGEGSIRPSRGAGLHQFQDGRWVYLEDDVLSLVPALIGVPGDHEG